MLVPTLFVWLTAGALGSQGTPSAQPAPPVDQVGLHRTSGTVYVVAEIAPRLAGYDPGASHASFAVEKRAGGHSFQLNFSNSFATTMGQIARGALTNDDWYIGFNITRKFYRGR